MNRIEELEEQIKKIQDEIATIKSEKRPNKRWQPEEGQIYYFVNSEGFVSFETWSGYIRDENRYKMGNVFKTHDEAYIASERLEVIAELKEYARDDIEVSRFYIYYSVDDKEIDIGETSLIFCSELYFESEEIARTAIAMVGEERVKKYYLGVKDE